MYYIYITTNLINGKRYIGQHKTDNPNDSYLGSGKLLKEALVKYGKENFIKEILDICETPQEANDKECYYIALYNAVKSNDFYNLSEGGQEGAGFKIHLEKLKNDPEYARQHEEKRLARLKEWQQANPKILSELGIKNIVKCHQWCQEHREELSKKAKEKYPTSALKKWTEGHPEEHKANLEKGRQAMLKWNQEHPEQMRQNLALGPQASKAKLAKKVKCLETGEIFNSAADAERHYQLCKDAVGKCARGTVKTTKGAPGIKERLHWEYI